MKTRSLLITVLVLCGLGAAFGFAIGQTKNGGVRLAGALSHPASVRGTWMTAHDDLETAEAAADLLKPWNVTRSTFHWVKVPDGATRVLVRAKIDLASTTYTTAPVVRIIGAFPPDMSQETARTIVDSGFSGTTTDATFAEYVRLDNADANAAGITLAVASAKTTCFIDNTGGYIYLDPYDLTGFDLKGASYVGILVETAGAVTGGASNGVYGQLLFLN